MFKVLAVAIILMMNAYDGCGRDGGWSTNPDYSDNYNSPTPGPIIVRGGVYDGDTGQPLDSVNVCLENSKFYFCDGTDSVNTFSISCPSPGVYSLTAQRDGYAMNGAITIRADGKPIYRNIQLWPR